MEVKNNPLNQIFKKNSKGLITEEIENPSNFTILFDYLKDNTNSINNKYKIIDKLTDMISNKRSIVAFLPKYDNKSIYIFFFDLYFNEKQSKELKDSILHLINVLCLNLQITKEVYEYIFQRLSKEYLKDKNEISEMNNSPKLFNQRFYDILNLLISTFGKSDKNKTNPRNYFACFGNNCNFTLNFNRKNFTVGNFLSFIINFKITKSKIMTENPEIFGKSDLIKFNFADESKILNIELKYPFFVNLNDGKKEYNAKVCPLGEWINLIMILVVNDNNLKAYFCINGENILLPLRIKNIKLQNTDIIKSISFFNNFYGEITSISMLSLRHNDSLNIFSQTLRYFLEFDMGLWNKRYLNMFINYLQGITFNEKKNENDVENNLFNSIVFIFAPFNYNGMYPDIIEDCLGKYNLKINGNIKNHRYQNYQKKIMQIANINNFIPIAEMLLIYQKELLNKTNFLLYLKLISKIVLGKKNVIFMNDSNFFQLLSLFIEKIPNYILNEDVIDEFDNIGKTILKHNVKGFSSNFFNDILINEAIIFKFKSELHSKIWNIILHYCLTGKEKIESFITMKKICIFLRYYDRNRYKEICCSYHLNMYKKEFIGNIKVMEPTLNERLICIKKILHIIIKNQNPEKLISLYRLLMLDLSPCLKKLILNIFITVLDNNNKNEEWKNKLVLGIIGVKYDIIITNAFVHSLPDVRYEILILMNYIFMRLVKLNKISQFISFEKMIKTCLLPQDIFYMEKKNNDEKSQDDFDAIEEFNKKYNIDKNKTNKNSINEQNNKKKSYPLRYSKSNYISERALQFDKKNKLNNNEQKQKIMRTEKTQYFKRSILEDKKSLKINNNLSRKKSNDNLIIKNNNNKQQNTIVNYERKNRLRQSKSTLNLLKKKEETEIEYLDFKEGESIYNNNKNEILIFREELYDIYINSLYILFLKWTLGIPIVYSSSMSSELFSSLKQQKDISSKNYFLTNMNIFEFIFILNNCLNNIHFTLRCLQYFERLILLPENSYCILSTYKIYSALLDITFTYYNINNCSDLEKELYKIGKRNSVYIFINSLNYLNGQNKECPMEKLEIIFLWGDKIILSNINDNQKVNLVLDFIYELLLDIYNEFIKEFGKKLKKDFELNDKSFNPMEINNFVTRNYLIYLTYVYNFCFHYKIDPIIKNSDTDAFFSVSLNINIPEIFISGMRMDNNKGNNIREYWKDFYLIGNILNKVNYIFKSDYIKERIFGKNYKEKNKQIKNKEQNKENSINIDKYNNILNALIKDKKDLFKNELILLSYYEYNKNKEETIIPLIRIISISFICILTIVKDSNDIDQFKHYLKEYKNLIKFTILASLNLAKNTSTPLEIKIYTKIQDICLDIIGAGLCFLNNLYECSSLGKDLIQKYINELFLLCFTILKYYYDETKNTKGIKIFNNKFQVDYSSKAVIVLFTEYIKDKNNSPFININNLETKYLNPSFKIVDLISENCFYESLFENNNLKKKLFEKYYSINRYKLIVDNRYNEIRTLDDKLDYSYQLNILNLLSTYETELIKYYNSYIKRNKKLKNMYIKQKKIFFSWNGLWSNRKLFYQNINDNMIKYKIINHYTKSLMRPLILPILDINYYLPKFTEFNKNKLFNSTNNNNSYDLLDMKISQINYVINKDVSNNKVDHIKRLSSKLLKNNDESKNNYLKYLYHKSNPKLYDYLKKVSDTLNFWKKEELKENFNNNEKNDNSINDDNKYKDNKRKDTQITSSSTIKIENNDDNSLFKNNYVNLIYDKDNNKLKNEEILNNKKYFLCCLVKPSHHVKGIMYIRDKKLNFKIFSNQKKGSDLVGINDISFSEKDDDYDKERGTCFGSYFTYHPKDKNLYKMSIIFNEIKWILKRKYYYKNSAIEIFTINNKSYYFNFKDEETQKIIINEIISKIGDYLEIINDIKELPNNSEKNNNNNNILIGYQNNSNPLIAKNSKFKKKEKQKIRISQIIIQWKNWEFTNFELLILLNIFSNRSYNDISQYPIFPWLLTNYKDPLKTKQKQEKDKDKENINEKDIEEKKSIEDYSYRDLSLQMGMLKINDDCIKRIKNYLSTYKILKQEEGVKPYIFGCNYSNATYVCNYLIRLFPFSQICIEIQGEGFDNPNRLFTSIDRAFTNATTQSTDIREIIPEFFYFPEILLNLNDLNLGKLNGNVEINNVITPCNNNPYEFISTMKIVLESENVSYNINNWIDLIFGYKAKGKEAENVKNIFTEQSYQEDININDIKEKDNYLRYVEFGLIPNQLFNNKEFPQKEKIEEIKKYKQIMDDSYNLKKYNCQKDTNYIIKLKNDLLLLTINNISQDKLILFYNTNTLVEKKITYSLFDKEYCEEIIEVKYLTQTLNKISNYFKPYKHNNKNIKIINNGKILIMGGYYDGKIIIIDIQNINSNKPISEIYPFNDESPITTIHVDKDEEYLFVGNSFGNIIILKIDFTNINEWKATYLINSHSNSVSSIDTNNELNIFVSSSIDGYINIYTLPLFKLTKSFKIPSNSSCNYVYICDSPLSSIVIICQSEIYLYSINGYLIWFQKENNNIINPIMIKDFYKNDYLAYIINNKVIFIRNIPEFSIKTKFENDNEIYYLCPGIDMKILYAINKNGTQIDVITCDTKKTGEPN